jgi:hypothetical protein
MTSPAPTKRTPTHTPEPWYRDDLLPPNGRPVIARTVAGFPFLPLRMIGSAGKARMKPTLTASSPPSTPARGSVPRHSKTAWCKNCSHHRSNSVRRSATTTRTPSYALRNATPGETPSQRQWPHKPPQAAGSKPPLPSARSWPGMRSAGGGRRSSAFRCRQVRAVTGIPPRIDWLMLEKWLNKTAKPASGHVTLAARARMS